MLELCYGRVAINSKVGSGSVRDWHNYFTSKYIGTVCDAGTVEDKTRMVTEYWFSSLWCNWLLLSF